MNTTSNDSNRYAPPTATVSDIADSEQEQAGRGVRLGAVLLDGLIAGIFVYVPLLIGIGANAALLATQPQAIIGLLLGGAGIAALVGFVVWAVITLVLVKRNSQTIGKKILGIKVVRSDGSHASLARIFWLRNAINLVIGIIPIVGSVYQLVDPLFIFGDKRQCLHDKIADTIVVKA